ncbi:hypothetical protein M2168_002167 [Streptomyces sp. CZ24]|nr:ADP-ribosyltransferase [Streptomyces sp. CZ24]MDH6189135.1 hypothetical protein [Streptomyces sp. CZ24]
MTDRNRQLDQAERDFSEAVAAALTATADEFADSVRAATELVAARFSVSRIARMWGNRTRGLVRRLLGTAEKAATAAAEDIGAPLPDGWDDLPGRYDDGTLPEGLGQYVTTTEHLLRAVGDRLAEAARAELAAGVDAGEDIDQLRARLRTAFTREGAHLGPGRERRIAQTEASRAWNTSTLAAAQAASGPDRPVVKQWITRHDARVRTAHDQVDGQIRLLSEPFTVAGVQMQAPGDPTAPPSLVIHCRCRLGVAPELRATAVEAKARTRTDAPESKGNRVNSDRSAFHGTQGRPGYRRLHPSGDRAKKNRKTQHANGGWLGSDRFTEDQHRRELRWYTGSGYRDINDGLRTGEYQEFRRDELLHAVAAINDLINIQDPTAEEKTLYRKAENLRQDFAVGDEFHDRGFLSTSAREEPVSVRQSPDDPNYTFYKITVPAGAQMVSVDAVGGGGEEEEFILPPGTKFRVTRVVSSGDPTAPPTYELEVINAVNASVFEPSPAPLAQIRAAAGGSFQDRITWQPEHIVVDKRASAAVTASAGGHTGAMIALMPAREDAERLALNAVGSEPASELHLTLFYLGEGADWDEDQRADLIATLRSRASDIGESIVGRAFGANQWNADGEDPCWVWSVGDDRDRPQDAPSLETARWSATYALEEMHRQPELPTQHTPWQAHVCAAYTRSPSLLTAMNQRLGPIRFDRLRVAFAGEHTDIPLGREEEATTMDEAVQVTTGPLAARGWHNPDDTALAFENSQTGDGRVFRPGSVYWSGAGPWPLQYADEMLMGHQGAELAGAIQSVNREGDRITGIGVLYPGRPAGADAIMLLEESAPLGVSVDLDDVSVEFVDRTSPEGEDEGAVVLLASLPAASLLRMDDGSWSLTASRTTEWVASGTALSRTAATVQLITGKDGQVTASAVHAALEGTGALTAAAGDPDDETGTVVHRESSGDLLMRVTRARLRGATLVAMPAYDQARIVLVDQPESVVGEDEEEWWAASGPSPAHMRVVQYVKGSPVAVGAREVARGCSMKMGTARGHLARAAKAGRIVRLAPGLYVGPSSEGPPDEATAAALPGEESDDETMRDLVASAWTAMAELPPMPAAWFKEPTPEELPPGSGGVHYADGRIYGWVAQAGEPHAGYPGRKLTIESLGKLDLTHFLRARFKLDDGSMVKAGAFTMNAPHHRDGAECESAACQFDDSRTVAGIVTVGQNAGGLWFSGAAGPWLSEWDRAVFQATQPSYHMKQGPKGQWQLRAVLSVPVPGHSSPLLATAVTERSNLALAASAALALAEPGTTPDASGHLPDNRPDTSAAAADKGTVTAPEQRGHRPDVAPDSPEDPARTASLRSLDVDEVASALLSSVPFMEVLVTALGRHQEQRDAARAETEALAASIIAPAREEIAAGHTTTVTEGEA